MQYCVLMDFRQINGHSAIGAMYYGTHMYLAFGICQSRGIEGFRCQWGRDYMSVDVETTLSYDSMDCMIVF